MTGSLSGPTHVRHHSKRAPSRTDEGLPELAEARAYLARPDGQG